jgi:hypothetical protein
MKRASIACRWKEATLNGSAMGRLRPSQRADNRRIEFLKRPACCFAHVLPFAHAWTLGELWRIVRALDRHALFGRGENVALR